MPEARKFTCYCRRFYLMVFMLMPGIFAFSQYNIKFQLKGFPAGHIGDSIYVAGNFNNWNPASAEAGFMINADMPFVEIKNLPAAEYQFKFTRGSWQKVQVKPGGGDVENHLLTLISDTIIDVFIAAWMDDYIPIAKQHTTSPNVHILDTAFAMPQLNRTRRIWLYLPPGYAKSKKRYPVIYMQDGQNIFDDYTSGYGEWGIDECLDSITTINKAACIVVGIDNGPKRMNEYNPFEFKDFGKGEGDEYVDFIVSTLKPYIDKRYRTLSSKHNTIIAGSSMGGLISYYAVLKYPEVFGKAGIFSPAFWTAEKINALTDSTGGQISGKLFFYMGGNEGGSYIDDMKNITEKLGNNSSALIYEVIDAEGIHNEQAWRKWFPEFYKWIIADGFNSVIKIEH